VRLNHLSERVAKFISRALEAFSSFDSRLLLLKLASGRFGVARGVSSRVCASREVCITLSFVDSIVSDLILFYGWLSEVKG
jgi:hypothetical protein